MARLGSWMRKHRVAVAASALGLSGGSAVLLQGRAAGSGSVSGNWKEALAVLRQHQSVTAVNRCRVNSFQVSHVASNSPAEDRHVQAHLKPSDAYLFTIIDGHSGWQCAHKLQERFPFYMSCTLARENSINGPNVVDEWFSRLTNSKSFLSPPVADTDSTDSRFKKSAASFYDAVQKKPDVDLVTAVQDAVLSLDQDLSREALGGDPDALRVASAGAVAASAIVRDGELILANTGDCRIVLGVKDPTGHGFLAEQLTIDHTAENASEVRRLQDAHPGERNVIAYKRLLGGLQPLRAFGDFVYKWPYDAVNRMFGGVPPNYHTPPYLTSEPEVHRHKLRNGDAFMILATDGLWDDLSNSKVVDIVGRHYNVLKGYAKCPSDMEENAATSLIASALQASCSSRNVEEKREYAAALLKLPAKVRRRYYDDITVVVVFFDEE